VSDASAGTSAAGTSLLALYDEALPAVYGYLLVRCDGAPMAEDLTAETFFAAVDAARRPDPPLISVPWLIGVARHKLVDHWRRQAREQRGLHALADAQASADDDPWDVHVDRLRTHATLASLGPHHRAALTLRYVDGLPVSEVAGLLDRSVHATEALLVRARAAFRRAYTDQEAPDG
jgi:RNA polymerase sigma-70 factor (ECF subfamily)